MRIRVLIAVAACLSFGLGGSLGAQAEERTLMYSYEREGQMVHIAFFDLSPVPVCHIEDSRELPKSARDFVISKQEFDRLWAVLASAEAKPFAKEKGAPAELDAVKNHLFTTAYLPDGEKKMFVVPKDRAPESIAVLAREIRAYNRD